jgi:hypothetical protein
MADVPSPERGTRPGREPHPRVGDRDSEAAERVVSEAAAQGRLDLDEVAERMDRVWAARTYGDLEDVLGDLQTLGGTRPLADRDQQVLRLVAGMGNRKQSGVWVCPPRIVAQTGVAGNVTVDLTESVVEHDVVRVEVIQVQQPAPTSSPTNLTRAISDGRDSTTGSGTRTPLATNDRAGETLI